MNVLVTSASRKVSLVQGFQAALAAEGGGRVVGADISARSAALHMADAHIIIGRSDAPGFVDEVLGVCESESIGLVVPTRDEELGVFAAETDRFLQEGVLVAVSSPDAVAKCQDKRAFLEFCAAHGFETPRVVDPEEALASWPGPLFVRPAVGKGSGGTRLVEDDVELSDAVAHIDAPIVQEYCPWPEFTVDVFAEAPGRVTAAVPRERITVVAGESFVGKTVEAPLLTSEAIRLVEALGLFGHITVQAFYDGTSVLFIEVNPRFGGGVNLAFMAGLDSPRALVRMALDRRPFLDSHEYRRDLVMLRYTQDVFIDESGLPGDSS